ncbi:MAG: type III pantothenate kinase [Verrucomicrobia bacterium]|nr:type III pantothenate kinase [Verrucomicrobiota bacterium]
MILLLDVGNTNTHVGWGTDKRLGSLGDIPTPAWADGQAPRRLEALLPDRPVTGACFCSVVPAVDERLQQWVRRRFGFAALSLNPSTLRGVGIDYPRPETIGQDRLANAVAVRHHHGAPALVVDFGTAVTFDVVDRAGNYAGGIIAPGLSAMTDYLHEKTALLPRIRIRAPRRVVGRNTEEAMLSGAVFGYRGLVSGIVRELKRELGVRRLPVIATGGYARLIARGLPELDAVVPGLTLEGLRLTALAHCGPEVRA